MRQSLERDGKSIPITRLDLDAIEKAARNTGTYAGALLMTAAGVPVVATLISALAFIAHWPNGVALPDWLAVLIGTPLLLGTIPTLIGWLLLGFMIRRFTAVDRTNMSSYGELISHLSTLDAQLNSLNPELGEVPMEGTGSGMNGPLPPLAVTTVLARNEALKYCDEIRKKLANKSLGWVTASGYIDLWKEVHKAESSLIDIMPRETVIANMLYDEMRIQDSKIDTSAELLRKLRIAVPILDPSAAVYLQTPPANPQGGSSALPTGMLPIENITDDMKRQARSVLREVRQALNDFRDGRWEAIVRVRNQFVCTTIFTGLAMYTLLQFAILAGVSQTAIIAATAFHLVGALVGLFSRLLNESQTSKSIDDYRLALARLAAIPLYCGLAGVGGVLVMQKLTTVVDIFDPKNLLSGLIIAAGFGLTPNLLINTLQKQTEQYKADLKSTAATQTQGAKTV